MKIECLLAPRRLGEFVALACGPRVEVHHWVQGALKPIAQHHAEVLVLSLRVVKNYLLYADAYQSAHLLYWRERDRQLSLLAKDEKERVTCAADFVIDAHESQTSGAKDAPSHSMGIVLADARGVLRLLQYAPLGKTAAGERARGGQKLSQLAAFALDANCTSFLRHRVGGASQRWAALYADLDGALGALLPLDERTFRRLHSLLKVMTNALPHNAALNPDKNRLASPRAKNILDGQLIARFLSLDATLQRDLANAIGSTSDQLHDDLKTIHDQAAFF